MLPAREDNPPRNSGGANVAVPRPASPGAKGTQLNSTNAVDPGPFKGTERNGEMVVLMFERLNLVLPRCGAIGLAYWLSELVD